MSEQKVIRTSKGLQDTLFDQIDRLLSGETTPQAARCLASLANCVVQIARLEMDHSRFIATTKPTEGVAVKSLVFGAHD